jgi:rubrerythrin
MESHKRVRPQDAREALQLALAAERRAESFYSDAATNARDAMVRSCAAELAEIKGLRLRQLENLLVRETRTSWFGLRLRTHPRTRVRGA